MRRLLSIASLVVASLVVGCGAAEEETPVEQKEEEAGVEEIAPEEETGVEEVVEPAKPTPEEIQTKGCPEGQVSNAAGTECMNAEDAPSHELPEEYEREQAEEWIRSYEAGEMWPNVDHSVADLRLECQARKAFLDGGDERVEEIAGPAFDLAIQNAQGKEKGRPYEERLAVNNTLSEAFADAGYTCKETPWARRTK